MTFGKNRIDFIGGLTINLIEQFLYPFAKLQFNIPDELYNKPFHMQSKQSAISSRIVKLMVGFFSNTNNTRQKNVFDKWVGENDANRELFEECLEITLRPTRPDPFEAGLESELQEMVELVMRQLRRTITPKEKQTLNRWMNVSQYHKQLSGELSRHGDIEIVYKWLLTVLKKDK